MKTSVEIDEKKLNLAKKLSHVTTIRELIDRALDAYISQNRREAMFHLIGTSFFDGNLQIMREKNDRSRR